jgi:hypothetical protein
VKATPVGPTSVRLASRSFWPGISLVKSVLSGEPVRGTWFNRTAEYRARLRGEDFEPRGSVLDGLGAAFPKLPE